MAEQHEEQPAEQQAETMTKADVLAKMQAGRAAWETLIAEIPRERMTELGVMGEWSMKDIIAHLTLRWG